MLDLVKDRDTAGPFKLRNCLPAPQSERIPAVAIDVSSEFTAAAQQAACLAVIVYDKFHVAKHLNEAVDKVRCEQHRRLLERGDQSLTGSKYLWLRCACPDGKCALSFAELCASNRKTSSA